MLTSVAILFAAARRRTLGRRRRLDHYCRGQRGGGEGVPVGMNRFDRGLAPLPPLGRYSAVIRLSSPPMYPEWVIS